MQYAVRPYLICTSLQRQAHGEELLEQIRIVTLSNVWMTPVNSSLVQYAIGFLNENVGSIELECE